MKGYVIRKKDQIENKWLATPRRIGPDRITPEMLVVGTAKANRNSSNMADVCVDWPGSEASPVCVARRIA